MDFTFYGLTFANYVSFGGLYGIRLKQRISWFSLFRQTECVVGNIHTLVFHVHFAVE